MASTNAAYRKPAQSASGKSVDSPFALLPLAEASDLHLRLRSVLVSMLRCNRFAQTGSSNFIFCAALTVAADLGLPTITVRRAIRKLVSLCVLELVHGENFIDENGDICRPRTYQVCREKLTPRMTLAEHRRLRFARKRGPIPVNDPPPKPPSPSAPAPAKKVAEDKTPQPKLTRRECAKFVADMAVLMKGYTRHVERTGGYGYDLQPTDRRYRAPMNWKEALIAACKTWKRQPEVVMEALKVWGYESAPQSGGERVPEST